MRSLPAGRATPPVPHVAVRMRRLSAVSKATPRRTGWWFAGAVALAAGVIVAVSGCGGATKKAPSGLSVLPFPGTPDASPQTQIAFPGLSRAKLVSVGVEGATSGRHSGRIVSLPRGHGTAYVPDQPFTDGDHVSVRATLSSTAAGSAVGAP